MKKLTNLQRQQLEINFWNYDPDEGKGKLSLENIFDKFSEFEIFYKEINNHIELFKNAKDILEIGGGSLWASCILKKIFMNNNIFGSDISENAIKSSDVWEKMFEVKLNYKMPLNVSTEYLDQFKFDLIFCYASAHHFVDFDTTFHMLQKMMKSNASLIFLHEPLSKRLFYPIALKRVNRKRPEVYEDLLQPHKLKKAAKKNNLKIRFHLHPSTINREGFSSVYYLTLSKLKFLNHILPTSVCIELKNEDS